MNGPETVGKEKSNKLLKFSLSNKMGCRISVKVWNEQIPRVIALIKPNNVSLILFSSFLCKISIKKLIILII